MTLKKSIAGHFKEYEVDVFENDIFSHKEKRKDWVDQIDIDMHPLEETAILKHWDIHNLRIKIPEKATQQQEHEWLIENGPYFVRDKRKEWQEDFDAAQPGIQEAEEKFQKAHQAWCDHADLCVAHGLCPNEYQGDARLSLIKPLEGDN